MKKYELAVVIKPLLPEDIKQKVVAKIEAAAAELEGKISAKHEEQWGKKHLAYRMKKNEEAFYAFFSLELAASNLKQFQRELSLFNDILRFLVIEEDQI